MAKKRRRPQNRPRPQSAVRTVERPEGDDAAAEHAPSTGPSRRPNGAGRAPASRARAEKKELARQQREEIRKRVQRAQRMRQLAWIVALTGVIGAAVFFFTRPDEPAVSSDALPGLLRTEAPWNANAEQAGDRSDLIGLPSHDGELAMHEHVNVQIFVHGEPVEVPTNIGIDQASGDVASLHTHEDSGTIHLESTVRYDFTLADVFDIWGVRLSDTCVGGYCEDGESTLRLFRNGQEITQPLRGVALDNQAVFVLAYGTVDEVPDPIPSTFDFASVPQ
ncbi:MAG: hypothetical protein ACXWX9_04670 [Actinomycetota bacterium]